VWQSDFWLKIKAIPDREEKDGKMVMVVMPRAKRGWNKSKFMYP
jgi:hypothetical protein